MPGPPVLKQYNPAEGIQPLANVWTLQRGGTLLICALSTHPLGWGLQLKMGENKIPTSQVAKTQDEVFAVSAAWREAAVKAGWAEAT